MPSVVERVNESPAVLSLYIVLCSLFKLEYYFLPILVWCTDELENSDGSVKNIWIVQDFLKQSLESQSHKWTYTLRVE